MLTFFSSFYTCHFSNQMCSKRDQVEFEYQKWTFFLVKSQVKTLAEICRLIIFLGSLSSLFVDGQPSNNKPQLVYKLWRWRLLTTRTRVSFKNYMTSHDSQLWHHACPYSSLCTLRVTINNGTKMALIFHLSIKRLYKNAIISSGVEPISQENTHN